MYKKYAVFLIVSIIIVVLFFNKNNASAKEYNFQDAKENTTKEKKLSEENGDGLDKENFSQDDSVNASDVSKEIDDDKNNDSGKKRYKLITIKQDESKNTIPEGFEDLNEDIYTLVNIYFGDELIDNVFATVNSQIISFSNPKQIVDKIQNIKNKLAITQSLTGSLDTNSHLSCFPVVTNNCGEMDDLRVAKIIYSPDEFRADIMINPKYINKNNPIKNYITSSQKGISSITGFNNIFSGSNVANGTDNYSLNGTSIVSYKNSNIETTYNYSNDSKIFYDNIIGKHYHKDTEFKFGLTSMTDINMVSSPRFVGFGVNRFFNSSDQLGMIYGSKIDLFLPYRSRVKILKDGKVIHSKNYDFGNQVIDSSSLPMGAYDIDIDIEDGRGTNKKTMFFVKSNRMMPADHPLYYLDAGFVEDSSKSSKQNVPEVSNNPIIRLGGGKRLTKTISLIGNVISSEKEFVAEGTVEYENRKLRVGSSYLLTNKQDYGFALSVENSRAKDSKLNYGLSLRKIIQGKNDDDAINGNVSYDAIVNSASRYLMNVNYLIKEGSFGFHGQRSQSGTSAITYDYGPFFEKNIFRKNNLWINFRGDITKYHNQVEYLLSFRVFYNQGRWSIRNTTSKNFVESQREPSNEKNNFKTSQNIVWQDNDLFKEDLTISALHDYDNQISKEEIGTEYKSKYGKVNLLVSHDEDVTKYNGNLQFSLLTNNSNIVLGGREFRKGAALINIKSSKNSKSKFDISTGGNARETGKVGSKTPIMLSPFRNYNISLNPAKGTLSDFDSKIQQINIMPGNVVMVDWYAKEAIIVLGRILFEDGTPLVGINLTSSLESSQSSDDGSFQLYSYKDDIIMGDLGDGKKCIATLPDDIGVGEEGIMIIDELKCLINQNNSSQLESLGNL